ncbi:hypothetical protein QF035_001862 [Streptomyces umbrinus]|uniref:Methionyl-tRNA formyltransferase n=1 Tax=Streptomyces umbrinus TaxID=67370 RepID=A0ABU0SL64_9ACTN|nr:hypothetical protein [Streptomyces umbrinus]
MRVVMFGCQTWGHLTLQALLDSGLAEKRGARSGRRP